jgi:apolipoprotein D and lipocalin family protein
MKKQNLIIGLILGLGCLGLLTQRWVAAETQAPPQTVPAVDLSQYMGKWYEIAAIPMFFERQCVANTTAEYAQLVSGEVSVFNSCEKANGKRQSAVGQGKVVDTPSNAKLKISFLNLPLLGWQFWASGDYWIIDLAPDYSTALIGHPNRKYGWILARTPQLSTPTLNSLSQKLSQQGYNPCDFITMPQTGGITTKQALCTVTGNATKEPTQP